MIFEKSVLKFYKKMVFTRFDGNPFLNYYSHEDFEGLTAHPYQFKAKDGNMLKGNFYSYEGASSSPLVVFDHGIGGGHRSYMCEIERLCRLGYTVFGYDHVGCMASEGENCGGLGRSLSDLDDCLSALKADKSVDTSRVFVMGHSWGGFACLNIPAFHPDVEKSVVMSGFVSVKDIVDQNFPGILALYRKAAMRLEKEHNGKYAETDGVQTALNATTKYLLIYSDNDKTVTKDPHYDKLYGALSEKGNGEFLLESGKWHNPHYSHKAVEALGSLTKTIKTLKREDAESFKNSFDWSTVTQQDDKVWQKIEEFLKK